MPPVTSTLPRPLSCSLRRAAGVALSLVFVATSCGGGDTATASDANIVDAGSFKVELPDEIVVVPDDADEGDVEESSAENADSSEDKAASDPSADVSEAAPEEPTPDEDAIPLQEDGASVTGLFEAFDDFQACLERNGTEFLGVPNPEVPETIDPAYIAELTTCAAESGILEAQQGLDAAAAERTLEEREIWNESILVFVDCMRGKGWKVSDPQPDAYGSLQIGDGTGGTGIEPPPGESILNNPVVRDCASEGVRNAEASTAENG